MPVRRVRIAFALLCLCLAPAAVAPAQQVPAAELRTWTSSDGRTLQARYSGMDGDTVVFHLASGQEARVPLTRLSAADQAYVKAQAVAAPNPGARTPIEKRAWPQNVVVPPNSIEIKLVEEKPADRIYRYRSQAFEFVAQDKLALSVMIEVARIFEGTRSLVEALPWGVNPRPPPDLGLFQAKLYVTRDAYFRDGAPPNSGGVYSTGDRLFRVPFDSIGLVMRGKTWFKDAQFSSDALVHEITHQMMHDYLPFLPNWIGEGCAEYTNMLPYNAGTFRAGSHEQGIREYIRKHLGLAGKGLSALGSPAEHMNMTPAAWAGLFNSGSAAQRRLYGYSCLLVYFFCHLDGDGKGTRFLRYFDALTTEAAHWQRYRYEFTRYREAMEEFFKQPGVKKLGDGRFTYPSGLTPPKAPERPSSRDQDAFGLEQMSLLVDGRTPAQLEEDLKAGFKKIGVRW